jgi:hypothetical protein
LSLDRGNVSLELVNNRKYRAHPFDIPFLRGVSSLPFGIVRFEDHLRSSEGQALVLLLSSRLSPKRNDLYLL